MHTKQERSSEKHLCLSNFPFADSTADSLQPIFETFKNILTGTNDSSTSGFGKDMRALVISFSFFIPIFFASRSESANNGDLTPTPPSDTSRPRQAPTYANASQADETKRRGDGQTGSAKFPKSPLLFSAANRLSTHRA